MATSLGPPPHRTYVPMGKREPIRHSESREISLLVAGETLGLTHASYSAGERVAGPHIHRRHTDAFYVLEGELTLEIGPEPEPVTIAPGGFVAAPPGVAHSFRTAGPAGRAGSPSTHATPDPDWRSRFQLRPQRAR